MNKQKKLSKPNTIPPKMLEMKLDTRKMVRRDSEPETLKMRNEHS